MRLCPPSVLPLLLLQACVSVSGSVAAPTALERQLLGEYQELDDELIYAASVRGATPPRAQSFTALKALALEQRAIQRMNEDDVEELKAERCLAESLEATLVARPCALPARDPQAAPRIERVVEEENRAREAILSWAALELARGEGRTQARPDELRALRMTYQRLLREAARPGQLFEVEPGQYREVPAP